MSQFFRLDGVVRLHLLALLLVMVGQLPLMGCGPPGVPCRDCNVLLISIDTLRADRLSLYGYQHPTSPFLEELAADAVVFDQAFNNGGFTLPVHVSMMTSLPPPVHGIRKITSVLDPARVTLAERLADSGWATMALTDGAWMAAQFGLAQGFETYDDSAGGLEATLPKALTWIESQRRNRWFLFIHTYDVHTRQQGQPYHCPGGWAEHFHPDDAEDLTVCVEGRCGNTAMAQLNRTARTDSSFEVSRHVTPAQLRSLSAHYDGCIRYADDQLRTLIDRLRALGLFDRTLVVITSDHGEEVLDHGRLLHDPRGFEEIVHVPLIVKLPGSWLSGRRVPELASTIDIMPTILAVVGLTPGDDAMGVDLLGLMETGARARKAVPFQNAYRTSRWKYFPVRRQLYDLKSDPGERRDVAGRFPDRVRALDRRAKILDARYRRHREAFESRHKRAVAPVAPTQDLVERLEALGYVD